MKTKTLFLFILAVVLAAAGGWAAAKLLPTKTESKPEATAGPAKTYSCSMHPQVRMTKPGNCPFCGMALAPLGAGGNFAMAPGMVMLSTNRINAIHVQTTPAQRQALQRTLRVAGTIEDNDTRHRLISAYVDGRVDKLFVNYLGAEVSAGQPLAMFYSPALLNIEREFVTMLRLGNSTNAIVQAERIRLMDAASQRLSRLGLTDEQIAGLETKAETNIHTEILAPISGTVVARHVYEGQYVKEGEKLLELADFSTMWFQFDAYERDLPWIRAGQKVEVTTPSEPGKTFTGAVTFIDPNIKDMSRSAKVRVELDNPLVEDNGRKHRLLLHRLYADGAVNVTVPEVLAVPRSAVLANGQHTIVYVDKGGGIYEQRMIKLGRAGDDLYEVLDGLKEDEPVVTTGNLLIDAQAQLENGSVGGHEGHGGPAAGGTQRGQQLMSLPANLPEFNAAQRDIVSNFLAVANVISLALANAKLDEFNSQVPKLQTLLPEVSAAFEGATEWQPFIAKLHAGGHLANAADIESARKAFYPFTIATVDFARAAKRQAAFQSVKVFKCFMAPRAGMDAYWMQLEGPLRNPFYGGGMIDCGTEVKP